MTLFLDASMLLAASGSETGALRAIFQIAERSGWSLISSPYAVSEVIKNLPKLPRLTTVCWLRLRTQLLLKDDIVSMDRPVIFAASKDRPILFSALAWSDVLLTLDRQDFADLLGSSFYGLKVRTPADFLTEERALGRI